MDDSSKNDRDFFRVATGASVIGMAILGGILGSIKGAGLEFAMEFSIWTILGAVIGGVFGWAIWKVTRTLAEKDREKSKVTSQPGTRHKQ